MAAKFHYHWGLLLLLGSACFYQFLLFKNEESIKIDKVAQEFLSFYLDRF